MCGQDSIRNTYKVDMGIRLEEQLALAEIKKSKDMDRMFHFALHLGKRLGLEAAQDALNKMFK